MASAAEQLAANINFGAFAKAPELKKRLWFTLGALIIYRLGTWIPIPGVDPQILEEIFSQQAGGIIGVFDLFAGGALSRMTIFALNIMPYISAAIIMQLLTAVSPTLEALKKEGEAGRKKINQYTRYGTVLLAAVQAYGISVGLEGMSGSQGSAVINPGLFFRLTTVITLVGGTIFLMWLGEQITQRGIGNGISLIIFSGIVAGLPAALTGTLELSRQGAIPTLLIIALLVMSVAVIAFIVFVERAQRRYEELSRARPDHPVAFLRLAELAATPDERIDLLTRIVETWPAPEFRDGLLRAARASANARLPALVHAQARVARWQRLRRFVSVPTAGSRIGAFIDESIRIVSFERLQRRGPARRVLE